MKIPRASLILVSVLSIVIRSAGAANEEPGAVTRASGADAAATKASSPADSAKHYTLYMGSDVVVRVDDVLCPVRGVSGSNWIVDFKGEQRLIPTKLTATRIKVVPNLKMAQRSASIGDFTAVRGYSFDNDPSVRLTRGLDKVATMNTDLISMSRDAQARVDTMNNKALGGAALFASADDQFSAGAVQASAGSLPNALGPAPTHFTYAVAAARANQYATNYTEAQVATQNFYEGNAEMAANQTGNGYEPGSRLGPTGFDAMRVAFEVSSPVPIRSPYVVTVAQFHPKGSKPGTAQNLVYAKEIHEIGVQPTRVEIVESGYPYDFELLNFQLHVYSNGLEIPTTISQKRVDLNWEDAFEYLKLDYMGAHKEATLPAVPVMATLPSDLPARLAAGQFRGPLYVSVSKDGLGQGAYSDPSCKNRIDDPYVWAVVRSIRFTPALAEGKPVEGVTPINLRKLDL
jgi:hypothetical protein